MDQWHQKIFNHSFNSLLKPIALAGMSPPCLFLDDAAQGLLGSSPNHDGSVIYHVKSTCKVAPKSGTIPACPPYRDGRELSCVVCTK